MNKLCFILLCATGLIAGLAEPGMAQTPPEQIEAYILVVKAGQEEKAGNLKEAITLYQQAADRYAEVIRQYPDWQPEIMRYRIVQSRNQAERLSGLLPAAEPVQEEPVQDAPVEPVIAESMPAVDEAAREAEAARDALRREEIAILEGTIEEAEAERAALQQELEGVKAQLAEREEQMAALREEAGALREEAGRTAEAKAIHEALRAEVETLQARLQAAESASAASREELERTREEQQTLTSPVAALTSQLADANAQLEVLQGEAAASAAASTALREEHQALVDRAKELEEALAAAQQSAATAIQAPAIPVADLEALQAQLAERETALGDMTAQLAKRNDEFESAVKMNQEYERNRRLLEDERNRLVVEVQALKKQLEHGRTQDNQEKELRDELRALKAENRDLTREIAGLNKTLERRQGPEDAGRLRELNLAMAEELRVYRSQLATCERNIRELEQQLLILRQGPDTPKPASNR